MTEPSGDDATLYAYLVHDGKLHRVRYPTDPSSPPFVTDAGGPYASTREWFARDDTIRVDGRRMAKFGFPRIVGPTEVVPGATYDGVPILGEPGRPLGDVVWVPVGMYCVVQPYQEI